MSKFAVPTEITEALKDTMRDNTSVKLPFPAPNMWWMNGKAALKNESSITDARRFGGWGISKEDFDELGISPAPSWNLTELTNEKGNTYSAYICRTAWVAPIARRFAWFENEGKSRSSLNILCYLMLRNQQGEFLKYGAVVLSAKSLSGVDLDQAFRKFTSQTAAHRDGADAKFFLHGIGTFGDTPIFKEAKGKGGASSTVTPPQLFIPKDGFNGDNLEKYFVPQEVMMEMAHLGTQAQEWLDDWNKRGKVEKQQDSAEVFPDLDEPA
jgi:hypothetical protein